MEFRILGPLEVWTDGAPTSLGGRKQRALLAMLLLRRNQVVSRDALIDGLWGERPPPSAGHTIEAYVHRLRKVLHNGTDESRLLTRPGGYLLRVGAAELDLDRFQRLVEEARAACAANAPWRAADELREALALWRGPPFGDLDSEPFAGGEVEWLAELHQGALEERIEADLALGQHHALIPELEALVARFPLRERLRGQLMLALHREGRQADALQIYRDTHRHLVDELGLEPSASLRTLERAILRQDPALELAPSPVAGAGRSHAPRSRGLAVLAGLALAAVAVASVVGFGRDGSAPASVRGNGLASIGLDNQRVGAVVPLDSGPGAVAFGFGSLWVTDFRHNAVVRVDPAGRVVQTIPVGSGPAGIAAGAGAVWVANNLDGTVSRIDPQTQTVVQEIDVTGAPADVAVTAGAVWVAGARGDSVVRIDPRSGKVEGAIAVEGRPRALTVGAGALWVSGGNGRTITRVDPKTNAVTATIPVGGGPDALSYGQGALWVANSLDGTISRVDPARNAVTSTIEVGDGPTGIAIARGMVWVVNEHDESLVQVDPRRGELVRTIGLDASPVAIATAGTRLWVGVRDAEPSHRGGTLVLLHPAARFDSIDPALQHTVLPAQLLGMTNDGLISFKHVGGRDGTQLVPDLATGVPFPTNAGRRYTFHLRAGIRYSNGEPVRAGDIRRGIERVFKLGGPAASYYDGIVGAAGCKRHPLRCDLSRGIVAADRDRAISFNLTAPDPDFLYQLALPFASAIPRGTPSREVGRHPVPATGPYMIASYRPRHELRLVRNPFFREWSRAARPDGYADQIVWKFGVRPENGISAVINGRADWMLSIGQALPSVRLRELEQRYPSQLHVNPLMQTDYMIFNVNTPPFDDVRVRRALNYALDRRAIARLFGASGARPTCQILPPQMSGYVRHCPYTRRPSHDGAWHGPDLAAARRLIRSSGTSGMKVVVWDTPEPGTFLEEGRATVALLHRLGYRASLRLVPDAIYARKSGNSRFHVQMSSGGWSADYPSPSSFIKLKLSCAAFRPGTDYTQNAGGFCDPAIDRQVDRAQRLQTWRPQRAARLWQRIERQLVARAVWLPMVTPRTTDFVSRRVGNYQFHPLWGLLVDQLWVR